jgi:hypothetical protein
MKKRVKTLMTSSTKKLYAVVLFLSIVPSIMAQTSTLKTGPIGLAFGYVSVCYERAISDYSSLQFTLNPYHKVKDYNGTAFGASLEFRWYFTKKEVLNGFYIEPRAGSTLGNLSDIETGIDQDARSINFAFNLGYQWVWKNGLLLDIGFGPKYAIGIGSNTAREFDRVSPDVIFGFGYAF